MGTRYWTKRRHLLQYIDKYRWIFKVRKNNMEARKYIAPMFVKDYKSPEFRHPGFWPGSFGYHQAQNLLLPLPSIDRRKEAVAEVAETEKVPLSRCRRPERSC